MMPGVTSATCYIFPGIYTNKVTISSNKNPGYMVFTKLSNAQPIMFGNSHTNFAFKITNANKVQIHGIAINSFTNYGIEIMGKATNNYFLNNIISSNASYGIYINSPDAYQNYILTNNIWGGNQISGIYINSGIKNIISYNKIHNNGGDNGIELVGNASSNSILKNAIYSNGSSGIWINSNNANDNFIMTNNIWGANQQYGICFYYGHRNIVKNNQIHHNGTYGVDIKCLHAVIIL